MDLPDTTSLYRRWLDTYEKSPEIDADTVGHGPLVCSSSVALEPFPQHSWDVNGYYRELGVYWKATRKQLRLAYQRLQGQESRRLTYVLKQLLDPVVRRAYDGSPLGEPFLDDVYVQEELKRRAACEASRQSMSGVSVSAESILDQQGLRILDDTFAGGLANDQSEWSYDQAPDEDQEWRYSFYIWDTSDHSGVGMAQWQRLLVERLAWEGRVVQFAVGMHARDSRSTIVTDISGVLVFFLRVDLVPTAELADEAVFKNHRYPNPTH